MTMHISLPPELQSRLSTYAKGRKKKMSGVIQDALTLLFSVEGDNALSELAFFTAIESKFTVPKNIPHRSFYTFLYLLANRYPEESSKDFWTETIYLSSIDKTHTQIFEEIGDDYRLFMKKQIA